MQRITAETRTIQQINTKLCDRFTRTASFINFRGQAYTRAELTTRRRETVTKVEELKMELAAIAISIKAQLEPASIDALVEEYCTFPYQYAPVTKIIHQVIVSKVGEDEARELISNYAPASIG